MSKTRHRYGSFKPYSIYGQSSRFPYWELTDNGSEFINAHLMRYCKKENIQFTRSRPMKKNDNCYVEQKNNSVVRRAVGYLRYETDEARSIIEKLYRALNPSVNFFYPVRKLVSKTRKGAKQSRHYDTPATPYQRLLRC